MLTLGTKPGSVGSWAFIPSVDRDEKILIGARFWKMLKTPFERQDHVLRAVAVDVADARPVRDRRA